MDQSHSTKLIQSPIAFSATSSMSAMNRDNLLSAAATKKHARSARVSSWDHSGKNEDAFIVRPGESIVLADIEG